MRSYGVLISAGNVGDLSGVIQVHLDTGIVPADGFVNYSIRTLLVDVGG